MAQDIANMLNLTVERPAMVETTALAAAMLAATGAGLHADLATAGEAMRGELSSFVPDMADSVRRSEEHTSELQALMRISDGVFCLKNKKRQLACTAYNTKTIVATQ